jgi:hypothetical protein
VRKLQLAAALAVVYLIAACSSSGPSGPQAGTVSGTISSSLGGAIGSATVTVTPTSGTAPASVQSAANGTYSVPNVPGGGGTVAISNVPANCTVPAAASYSGVNANTITVNVQVTCVQTGTLMGTVTSSLTQGAGISGATVTVTPTGASALPSVTTNSSGQYSVPNVPYGSGTIALSNLPAGCTPSGASNYSLNSSSNLIDFNVPCTAVTTTTLNVGQAALFTDSPQFATNLTLAPNGIYLITVVNTDSTSTALEDFSIGGTLAASVAARKPPVVHRVALKRASVARVMPRVTPELKNYKKAVVGHINKMEADERRTRGLANPLSAVHASRRPVSFSLVGTQVGDVNMVNVPVPSCDTFTTVGARTVYSGTHVQILADTSLTNWPSQYRPDSSYYNTLGLEYDTLTYAKHLLTYIGDPLQYDADLSGVGKVTVLLTPELNNVPGLQGAEILAFVSSCDFFARGPAPDSVPSSNETEMIYHLVPDANNSVAFWEREIRPTLAHESKHIVSLGYHIANGQFYEQTWLEEALAQVSSEIWGRNYNTATWLGDAGFNATLGCEISGDGDPCSTPTSPLTFSDSHLAFLFSYLAGLDTLGSQNPETLNGTVAGRYGAGWSLARWAIDNYASGTTVTAEATIIKALITNVNQNGIANIAAITGASAPQIFTYWSLATALDQSTLADSAAFLAGITDPKTTVPSFDFRNIFAPAPYGRAYSVVPFGITPGNFTTQDITGIPGTEQLYIAIQASASGGTQFLQLLSGSGGTISSASGFRVGIIRVQ